MFAASKLGSADAKDPQFNYVTMLLHGDGTNGAQNNTFLDSSTNNFTITRNGNTTQGTFTPYGSNWSNYFNASTDKLTLTGPNLSGLTNFTFECWVNFNGFQSDAKYFLGVSGASYYQLVHDSAGGISFRVSVGYIKVVGETSNSGWTTGTWYHVALVKNGNDYTIYKNGVSIATNTYVIALPSVAINYIGGYDSTTGLNAYMSNARITNTAVYTSSFTPSTTPLTAISGTQLLTCQSNRFVDNSTNAYALTASGSPSVQRFSPFNPTTAYSTSVIGGSGYFDGSGDYLGFPNNTAFDFSTGDFTVEAWVYRVGTGSGSQVYEAIIGGNTSGVSYWTLYVNSSNNTVVWYGNDSTLRSTSNTITNNTWNHVAVSRSSGTLKIFINGVQGYSASVSTSYSLGSGGGGIGLDSASTGNKYFYGYINDTRVVKGTALYTSAFTPPTAPLTAVSGTSLLTNFTNAGILDNAMMNDLETVGNAQISTSVKKYGTGSMYFDGTGDYLVMPVTPNLYLGSGNFCIEAWVYITSHKDYNFIYSVGPTVQFFSRSTGVVGFVANDSDDTSSYIVNIETTTSISLNTWTHVAVVRNGSSFVIYINGVSRASGTSSAAIANSATRACVGDYSSTGGTSFTMTGYIDDLRITKGVARYTATFTPPTAPFPDKG